MDSLRMGLAISLRDAVCQPSQRWCKPTISKIVCAPASENRIPRKRRRKLFTFAYSDDCHTPPALQEQVKSFIFVLQLCVETNDYDRFFDIVGYLYLNVCRIDAHLQCIFPETCVFVNALGCSLKTQLLSNLPSSQVWKRLVLFKLSKRSPTAVNTKQVCNFRHGLFSILLLYVSGCTILLKIYRT